MTTVFLAGLVTAAVALAGCGSSSSSSTTSSSAAAPTTTAASTSSTTASAAPAAGALNLAADPTGQLKFDTKALTAKSGKVTIDFTNSSSVGHNVTVASASGAVLGATPTFSGGSKALKLSLKPGTYTFYCSVPGHRQAGMQGTLVVK